MKEAQSKKPPGRPKGEQVENATRRRRQLVEAAIDSIVQHGMSATTLATVAKAAGLSQGVAVFYFKSKENLLVETLRQHYVDYNAVWQNALAQAPDDPVDQLTALVMADLDPKICNPRNLTLWNSYWGEASARPRFAELCDDSDRERYDVMIRLCEAAAPLAELSGWSPVAVTDALDTMTDGIWTRMHITPSYLDIKAARGLIALFLATVYPSRAARIAQQVDILLPQ